MSILIVVPTIGVGQVKEESVRALKASVKGRDDVRVMEVGPEAKSWGEAVNRGFDARDGADVVIMDDDVVVDTGWLEELKNGMGVTDARPAPDSTERKVGIVGAKLRFPDGRLQHAGCAVRVRRTTDCLHGYACDEELHNVGVVHLGHGRPDDGSYEYPHWCPHVTFSLCLIKGELIDKIGGINVKYLIGMQYEDVDYSFQAINAGYSIIYWPRATAVHYESHSKRAAFGRRFDKATKVNEVLIRDKWFRDADWLRRVGILT